MLLVALDFGRFMRPQTPALAVLGEVREYPLLLKFACRVAKYWLRPKNLPETFVAKKLLEHLDSLGLQHGSLI